MSTLFTKIIKGEIPSHKIYEDELTYAFLDIYPPTEGRVLVVPKAEVDHFADLPDDAYEALWRAVRKVSHMVKKAYPHARTCVKIEGFDVPHAHVHVFPCYDAADFCKTADHSQEPDHTALAAVARKLTA